MVAALTHAAVRHPGRVLAQRTVGRAVPRSRRPGWDRAPVITAAHQRARSTEAHYFTTQPLASNPWTADPQRVVAGAATWAATSWRRPGPSRPSGAGPRPRRARR